MYLIGGIAGAVVFLRRAGLSPVLHLVAFLAYLSLLHMALFATQRYHIPAAPVLTVLFAYVVTPPQLRIADLRQPRLAAPRD